MNIEARKIEFVQEFLKLQTSHYIHFHLRPSLRDNLYTLNQQHKNSNKFDNLSKDSFLFSSIV